MMHVLPVLLTLLFEGVVCLLPEYNVTSYLARLKHSKHLLLIPPKPSTYHLQIPLDLTETTSRNDSRFCGNKNNSDNINNADQSDPCSQSVTCLHSNPLPLSHYKISHVFGSPTSEKRPERRLIENCHIRVYNTKLGFTGTSSGSKLTLCNFYQVQPSLHFSTEFNTSFTISFKLVQPDKELKWNGTFLNMTMSEVNGKTRKTYSAQLPQVKSCTSPEGCHPGGTYIKTYATWLNTTIEVVGCTILLFYNGEYFKRYHLPNSEECRIVLGFGSPEFNGTITRVTVYNTAAFASEVYEMQHPSPQSLPGYNVAPECPCPRPYMDSFSIIQKTESDSFRPDDQCYGVLGKTTLRYTGYNGGWAIFNRNGWISRPSSAAKIVISFKKFMLPVSIGGKFTYGVKNKRRPARMEIRISEGGFYLQLLLHVVENCTRDTKLHESESLHRGQEHVEACYSWTHIIYDEKSSAGSSYIRWMLPTDYIVRSDNRWDRGIPATEFQISFPDDDPHLATTIQLEELQLYSHHHLHQLISTLLWKLKQIQFPPNIMQGASCIDCSCSPYTLPISKSRSLHSYALVLNGEIDPYECHCSSGSTLSRCRTCNSYLFPPMYGTEQDRKCEYCRCTDLCQSTTCDPTNGQCECLNTAPKNYPNRDCAWNVSSATPLRGPAAGGTIITIAGDFITWPQVNLTASFGGIPALVTRQSSTLEIRSVTWKAPETVVLSLIPNTDLYVGSDVPVTYLFEYLTNPRIADISPTSTIDSGGVIITVTGSHLANTEVVEMVFHGVAKNELGSIEWNKPISSLCNVVNEALLHCPTPNLNLLAIRNSPATYGVQPSSDEISPNSLAHNGIPFTIGFVFDGLPDYLDLQKHPTLSQMSKISVYEDPVIIPFSHIRNSAIVIFRLTDDIIEITGKKLDWGVRAHDYTIHIGTNHTCPVTKLSTTTLTCQPPRQPFMETIDLKEKQLDIQVKVGNIEQQVGYIFYESINDTADGKVAIASSTPEEALTPFTIAMVVMGSVIGLIIFGLTAYCFVRRARLRAKENEKILFLGKKLNKSLQQKINRCLIPKERLTLEAKIGEGNFGLVYKGHLVTYTGNLKTVAVKTLNDEQEITLEVLESFFAEAALMINFYHENVMHLLGVVYNGRSKPFVLLPFMELKDLRTLIRRDDLEFNLGDVLHFGQQIANGMVYLGEKGYIHRDLAARNCLVNSVYIVKISDFGMTRSAGEKEYYKMQNMDKPLPIRWMAIESLNTGTYTLATDVWSYGVTVWELLTKGVVPYEGIADSHIRQYVCHGTKLIRPEICPPVVYERINLCWEEDPVARPTFAALSAFLATLLSSNDSVAYSYVRNMTRHIPNDYLATGVYADKDLDPRRASEESSSQSSNCGYVDKPEVVLEPNEETRIRPEYVNQPPIISLRKKPTSPVVYPFSLAVSQHQGSTEGYVHGAELADKMTSYHHCDSPISHECNESSVNLELVENNLYDSTCADSDSTWL